MFGQDSSRFLSEMRDVQRYLRFGKITPMNKKSFDLPIARYSSVGIFPSNCRNFLHDDISRDLILGQLLMERDKRGEKLKSIDSKLGRSKKVKFLS